MASRGPSHQAAVVSCSIGGACRCCSRGNGRLGHQQMALSTAAAVSLERPCPSVCCCKVRLLPCKGCCHDPGLWGWLHRGVSAVKPALAGWGLCAAYILQGLAMAGVSFRWPVEGPHYCRWQQQIAVEQSMQGLLGRWAGQGHVCPHRLVGFTCQACWVHMPGLLGSPATPSNMADALRCSGVVWDQVLKSF